MFRVKQIALVAILGMALVLATATVYTQSAQAGFGRGFGVTNPGGSTSGQDGQGQNDNSQGNEAGNGASGANGFAAGGGAATGPNIGGFSG